MPLNSTMKAQQYVQNREPVGHQTQSAARNRSRTPQPKPPRGRSQQHQANNVQIDPKSKGHDGDNQEELELGDIKGMKLVVPNTITKKLHSRSSNPSVSEERAAPTQDDLSRRAFNEDSHRQRVMSAFDDTQSIHFDDSTSIAGDRDTLSRPHFSFNHGRKPASLWTDPSVRQPPNLYPDSMDTLQGNEQSIGHFFDWQGEADAERARQGHPPKFGAHSNRHNAPPVYTSDEFDDGYEQAEEYIEEQSVLEDTPSRTRMIPEVKLAPHTSKETELSREPISPPLPKHRKSLSEVAPTTSTQLPIHQNINRFRLHKDHENANEVGLSNTTRSSTLPPQPGQPSIQPPPFSSKVSSYHESSSEEDQPLPQQESNSPRLSKRGRPDQELDFDIEILKTKKMIDLDAIPFTTDPSALPPQPAIDASGAPMTLTAKLTNLTKMRPEGQHQLFKSLTDAEREQTATWFLEKFKADTQKLMAVRIERRKVTLKFELDVKKRERQVEVKKEDVEQELAGLKKGGGELIGRRAAGGK